MSEPYTSAVSCKAVTGFLSNAGPGWMDRSNSNLAAQFLPIFPNFQLIFSNFRPFFLIFLPFFLEFLARFCDHFWPKSKDKSPSHLPVNLGHFGHTLGYFREIYDRNIRVNSLEFKGTGGSIWPQKPGSLTWIIRRCSQAFGPLIGIIGTVRSWARVTGPVRRNFSGGTIGRDRAGRIILCRDQILGPLSKFVILQV